MTSLLRAPQLFVTLPLFQNLFLRLIETDLCSQRLCFLCKAATMERQDSSQLC